MDWKATTGYLGRRGLGGTRRTPAVSNALFLLLTLAFLVFLATRFDIDLTSVWQDVTHSDPVLYGMGVVSFYMSFVVRGLRWRVILKKTESSFLGTKPVPSVLECSQLVLLARFADSVVFFRLGNFYRAYLASSSTQGSFPRVVGTLLAEHFLDMVVVLAALVGLGVFVAGRSSVPVAGTVGVALGVTAAVAVVLLSMRRFGDGIARRLPQRVGDLYRHFQQGALRGLGPGSWPLLAALSVAGWLLALARWYFVVAALGMSLSLPMLVFISLLNAVLAAVPITPGGLGVVEPGIAGVLTLSLTAEEAISVTLLERSISYVSIIVVGAALFFGRELYLKRHLLKGPRSPS